MAERVCVRACRHVPNLSFVKRDDTDESDDVDDEYDVNGGDTVKDGKDDVMVKMETTVMKMVFICV